MTTLPESFFDWWFTPWRYARAQVSCLPAIAGSLGQRDGYRLWCAKTGVQPDLPRKFDPGWQVAACEDGTALIEGARLFAGLVAARAHDQALLGQLPLDARKWCMSVAITQPLKGCQAASFRSSDAVDVRGLVELAWHADSGMPGIWTRLRLMLPPALAARVDAVLEAAALQNARVESNTPAKLLRAQRCWRLCYEHAGGSSAAPAIVR